MSDVRESILARLLVIATGLDGVATAARNPAGFDDLELPAIAINDADEAATGEEDGRGRAFNAPFKVTMTPEILIRVQEQAENAGTVLNGLRAKLIKAVLEDATLGALVTNGGKIRYLGMSTALAHGRTMTGDMGLAFGFTYILRSAELS